MKNTQRRSHTTQRRSSKKGTWNYYTAGALKSLKSFLQFAVCYLTIVYNPVQGSKGDRDVRDLPQDKQQICYGPYGCFYQLPPFSAEMPLPQTPEEVGSKFILCTRGNPDQQIWDTEESLKSSNFDPEKKTKVLIHGFNLNRETLARESLEGWIGDTTDIILDVEDVNVIQVDWRRGASVDYDQATSNTRLIGAQVGYLVKSLMEHKDARSLDFHLVGFSLGAHVAGFAGKYVQKTGNQPSMIGRITGLDPASPGFNFDNPEVRLDKTDAKFTDVIHTDTQTFLTMAAGLNRTLGHIDFYPNGGQAQTGCHNSSPIRNFMKTVTDITTCDHLRAPQLFKASINTTTPLMGYRCPSYEHFKRGICLRCNARDKPEEQKRSSRRKTERLNHCKTMGYWADKPRGRKHVDYYMQTSGEEPFAINHYQVQISWRKKNKDRDESGFNAKLFITLHGEKGDTEEIALNEGFTYHIVPGNTSRFLITSKDIGDIVRISFKWEESTCWSYLFCPQNQVLLNRIRIFDAQDQLKSTYVPEERTVQEVRKLNEPLKIRSQQQVELFLFEKQRVIQKRLAERDSSLVVPSVVPVGSQHKSPEDQEIAEITGDILRKAFSEEGMAT